jgi:hypothetical protein
MFAPKVAKRQTKAAEVPTRRPAPRRSTLVGQQCGHEPVEQPLSLQYSIGNQATPREAPRGPSWNFGKIPVFPPDRANRPQPSWPLATTPLPGIIQRKLAVGPVDDPLEHEADRVADRVMRMPDPGLPLTSVGPSNGDLPIWRSHTASYRSAGPMIPRNARRSASRTR